MTVENTPFKTEYTPDDAVFRDDKWHIMFTMPWGGHYEYSSSCVEHVVETVNDQIRYELHRKELLPLYVAAVDALLDLAIHHDGSGSKAAAQVLLSAYNSHVYQLAVVDLCNLDEINLAHAMAVMRGRVICMREPHTLIKNGDARFSELKECWPGLHVSQRYQVQYSLR